VGDTSKQDQTDRRRENYSTFSTAKKLSVERSLPKRKKKKVKPRGQKTKKSPNQKIVGEWWEKRV